MGVYKALPDSFAKIHRKYLTPSVSTIVMGAVSILFYLLFTVISTNLLTALIGSVGLMIAFYYGLTGFACVWFYRKTMWSKPRDILMQGVIPGLARRIDPKIVRFDSAYRDLRGLLVKSRAMDGLLLCGLPAATWDSTAAAMALSSVSVIGNALRLRAARL